MTCVKARALNQQAASVHSYEALLHCYVLSRLCSKIFFPKRRDYLSSVAGVFVMDQLVCTDMLYFLHS